jgi:UDP-N-acetylmuramate--alanine ligase
VWLTEIYPARELPIEGVTSQLIFDNLRADMKKALCMKQDLPAIVAEEDLDVLVVLGAGDVEDYMEQFRKILEEK